MSCCFHIGGTNVMIAAKDSNLVVEATDLRTAESAQRSGGNGSQTSGPDAAASKFIPHVPDKEEDLDVSQSFLAELALKAVSLDSDSTTRTVAHRLRLGI